MEIVRIPSRLGGSAALALCLVTTLGVGRPASYAAGPVACNSGQTAYVKGDVRLFGVFDGHRRPRVRLFACTRHDRAPVLLDSGRTGDVVFGSIVAGPHYLGWDVVHDHAPTADYDGYHDYRVGTVRLRDGLVRSFADTGYAEESYVYAVEQASGSIATLNGSAGGPQKLAWVGFLTPAGRYAKTPKTLYEHSPGAVVPASLRVLDARVVYRTRGGATRSIDPRGAPRRAG